MYFTIVVIINKAFKLFQLVLVVYCDSCWQGTLQARKTFKTAYKRPETLIWVYIYICIKIKILHVVIWTLSVLVPISLPIIIVSGEPYFTRYWSQVLFSCIHVLAVGSALHFTKGYLNWSPNQSEVKLLVCAQRWTDVPWPWCHIDDLSSCR